MGPGNIAMQLIFNLFEDVGILVLIAVAVSGFAASVALAFALFVGERS